MTDNDDPTGSERSPGRSAFVWSFRVVALLLLALVVLVAWIGLRAKHASNQLHAAANELEQVQTQVRNGGAGDALARQALDSATSGRKDLDDPFVRFGSHLPVMGPPLRAARAVALAAETTVRGGLLPLLHAAGPKPMSHLIGDAGNVDLDYLSSLGAPASAASQQLQLASYQLSKAPNKTRFATLDNARRDLADKIAQVTSIVDSLSVAAEVGPSLLGIDGPQRYFVGAQNSAEARGTGGLIGSYLVIEADAGLIRVVSSGSDASLKEFMAGKPVIDLGPQYNKHYGFYGPTAAWVNSNGSPHFPYAASIWAKLWQRQTGQQLSGVLAVDPVALSYLMRATGALTLSDGTTVSADNVVDLTLRDVYAKFADVAKQGLRKDYLQEISRGVAGQISGGTFDRGELVRALSRAAEERRLLLWPRDPLLQQALGDLSISGRIPEGRPAVGDVINDVAGSKLDYYLDRTLLYTPACGNGTSAVTLTLQNRAPKSGLPELVSNPMYRKGEPAGINRMAVDLYLPPQSEVRGVQQDGRSIGLNQGEELGLRYVEVVVTVPAGGRTELKVVFNERLGASPRVAVLRQPLVRPEQVTITGC
ncbi:MAG: hypothetical protein QOJ79_1428 [Actinomycetota bacterium]|jgi:hypothetical protein|nr:hypothetical protein [Actinomycetota bacterium]